MNRRDFFVQTGVGAGAIALASCGATAAKPAAPAASGPLRDWQAVRAEFDGLARDRVHMASFFLVSHPRRVREAIERHRRELDLDPLTYIEENVATFEIAVRAAASRYLGVQPDELALTDSTSAGIGIVLGELAMSPGQEILSTTHDHAVMNTALDYRAERAGTKVKRIALYDAPEAASVQEIVRRLAAAITPATRIIGVTWVHSGTGVKLPIRALADVVAKANQGRAPENRALLCVDGVHGLGNQDVALPDLGCDFFMAGTHKWIFGPRGTGIVWGKPDAWPFAHPTLPTMDPLWRKMPPAQMPYAAWMTPGGFHSFEHRWALAEAFDLHDAIGGRAKIAARVRELNDRCKQGLAKIPGVRVKTPMSAELSAGIICFEVAGKTPQQVVAGLAERHVVASVTPSFYTPAYARLAPSLMTLEDDVDRAVAALA